MSEEVKNETTKIEQEIRLMQIDLNQYEKKFGMTSENLYNQFEEGQLVDSKDFILWSGIYEMQLSCKEKLRGII